jgi:hypothetical protein
MIVARSPVPRYSQEFDGNRGYGGGLAELRGWTAAQKKDEDLRRQQYQLDLQAQVLTKCEIKDAD